MVVAGPGWAQEGDPLEAYVEEALASNLGLQRETLAWEQRLAAIEEARGGFLPKLDLQARYSVAEGGRTIDLPVGDLLNPVYGTLNDLLAAQGQDAVFPSIANVREPLLREREQETKLRLVQPLYEPRLRHNLRLQRHLATSQAAAVDAVRRQLVRDVKVAYYTYLQAEHGVHVYDAASELVRQNLRTSQALLAADRVTQDRVFRARAEVLRVEREQAEAERERDLARSYFNVLLDRDLDTPIKPLPDGALPSVDEPAPLLRLATALGAAHQEARQEARQEALGELRAVAARGRPELAQLDAAVRAAGAGRRLARTAYLPSVGVALDAGIQGTRYGFGDDHPYVLGSVVASWTLFDGFQRRRRLRQAELAEAQAEVERADAERQIYLQVQGAYDAVQVARRSLGAARERQREAAKSFRITARRYEEGMTNLVTLTDARTALTNASLDIGITQYDLLIRLAELEYAAALHPLSTPNR